MNSSLLTIYIRKKFLAEQDVLEHADAITEIFADAELDFSAVKEQPGASQRDVLIVAPPLSLLNEMLY